ncbi:MAG: Caldesmon [Ignavibacteria bacterium GWB2_35_12]|nr:MAG: Caldesmon [Ignavibacteria bacterium GWB2_35_12]OGU93841.1 MAG: Caldesmon [Ignavibacteria bacterium RIFOXYA2_FULL_35_10]OGV22049.1 MAG: Caldesmon [Ignavibacteria bacterium RIFOXYC2_FULL_35_21]
MEALNTIKCPKCGADIDVSDVLFHQIDEKNKLDYSQKLLEKENEFKVLQKQEKQKIEKELREQLQDENTELVKSLKSQLDEKSNQVKEFNKTKAELERITREKDELKEKIEAESELKLTQKLNEEKEKIQKDAEEKNQLKISEKEKIIDQLMVQLKEAQRKAEQGSVQLQGEVQELAIEEWLRTNFPLDTIEEIKKGARGADCIQIINTHVKQNCGSIYYESKRTKDFQQTWIEKFKLDMREKGALIGVLVTDVMPKEMDRMGQKNGIWICTFEEFKSLCFVLRESIVLLSSAVATQENKGDKMIMLYDYLTGNEFKMQVEAIVEGFIQMQNDLESEKRSIEGIWKKREKQIQKVLLNTNHMYNSIRGIAGTAIGPIKALELPEPNKDI